MQYLLYATIRDAAKKLTEDWGMYVAVNLSVVSMVVDYFSAKSMGVLADTTFVNGAGKG